MHLDIDTCIKTIINILLIYNILGINAVQLMQGHKRHDAYNETTKIIPSCAKGKINLIY